MQRPAGKDDGLATLERLYGALEASGDIAYSWDLATDRIEWFGRLDQIFGRHAPDTPSSGDRFNGRVNPEDLPVRMYALSEHLSGTGAYDCEYRVRASSGEFNWVHDRGAAVLSASGTPMVLSGALRLVTHRKLHEAQLEHLVNYDELTGQFNKLRLREALDHSLSYGQRYRRPGGFVTVGIDQLDRINTAYGFEVGDRVLVEVSRRLDSCVRASDVIGRLGGDRFGVILGSCRDHDEGQAIAERIIQVIRQTPVEADGHRIHVTASVGMVRFPEQSTTSFDVIAKAEGALLRAKAAGRDCVQTYEMSEAQRETFRESLEIGRQVTEALKDERLVFAYQPVVDARSREVQFYECLLRMISPQGEVVAAGAFVPVVERLGLMRALDRHALDLAIHDLETHPDITLAFNISGITAADRSWLRALGARLQGRPDVARRMIVEITETAALFDIEETARFVSAVRDLGCRVAMDDFGAGYTTFRHLKALTVDVVKIDGSFVRDLAQSEKNQLFVRNLLSLARTFDLVTVAECVETEADAAILAAQGVELLQGYYFGRPELHPGWRQAPAQASAVRPDGAARFG